MAGDPLTVRRSAALTAVVAAVGVEAVLLAGVAVFFVVEIFTADAGDVAAAAVTGLLALLLAGLLALCARGLWRRRRWPRGPVMTWQLLQLLGVALPSAGGERRWVGVALVLLCLAAGGGLLLPGVVRETTNPGSPPVG